MRTISSLRPQLQALLSRLKALALKEGIDFLVTDTNRSKDEQMALYAKGRSKPGKIVTNTPYPQSFHNHGVAFDVVPLKNGQPNYSDTNAYKRLGALGKSIGLEWGGDWKGFVDKPHFQLTEGKTWKDFANGYQLKTKIMNTEEIQKAENNLKTDMDLAFKALEKANMSRAALALLKGVPVKKYTIKDE